MGLVGFLFWHASRPSTTVEGIAVSRRDITSIVTSNGIVQPTVDFQAHASAPGQVKKLFVKIGDWVESGQRLVEMDTSDAASRIATAQASLQTAEQGLRNLQQGGTQDELLSQKADIAAARTTVAQDQQTLATRKQLAASGAASPNEVQQAQDKLNGDQAHLDQLLSRQAGRYSGGDFSSQKALVTQASTALSAAESDFAASDIRSPISGKVYAIAVNPYDYVQTGALLLNLADLNKLQVRAYFDEPQIGDLAAGQPVTIEWAAKPGKLWHGHVLKAPTTVTIYGTRNVGESIITVDDANGDLLPNTNVTVHVTTKERHGVLSLPREALHTQGANDYVYRVVGGKLARTPITVGMVNLAQFEITSGLHEGDVVVLRSTTETELSDGLPVNLQR
ncbi:HlyD family secretion protein [Bryocella elongata]|uniref:HlyD family secretion protein n=1 Tax=Bryocella elongata TaxID=863522 RepID=A0A1H5TPF1_9BACT|nr:HlyD family secretion protein [Bryocella elongata]